MIENGHASGHGRPTTTALEDLKATREAKERVRSSGAMNRPETEVSFWQEGSETQN